MARWMKPTEEMPYNLAAGDRVCVIVRERPYANARVRSRLVILVATETGWDAIEDAYAGYTPADGYLWSLERDVCQIAEVV